ncbi:hypothetical protein OPQ81_005723 [Rhizoctonia solani]|nr:hypothetical protein OPQ81_005723 [Rhizoctonia solani]
MGDRTLLVIKNSNPAVAIRLIPCMEIWCDLSLMFLTRLHPQRITSSHYRLEDSLVLFSSWAAHRLTRW